MKYQVICQGKLGILGDPVYPLDCCGRFTAEIPYAPGKTRVDEWVKPVVIREVDDYWDGVELAQNHEAETGHYCVVAGLEDIE